MQLADSALPRTELSGALQLVAMVTRAVTPGPSANTAGTAALSGLATFLQNAQAVLQAVVIDLGLVGLLAFAAIVGPPTFLLSKTIDFIRGLLNRTARSSGAAASVVAKPTVRATQSGAVQGPASKSKPKPSKAEVGTRGASADTRSKRPVSGGTSAKGAADRPMQPGAHDHRAARATATGSGRAKATLGRK